MEAILLPELRKNGMEEGSKEKKLNSWGSFLSDIIGYFRNRDFPQTFWKREIRAFCGRSRDMFLRNGALKRPGLCAIKARGDEIGAGDIWGITVGYVEPESKETTGRQIFYRNNRVWIKITE
jgi:hypothetical protein